MSPSSSELELAQAYQRELPPQWRTEFRAKILMTAWTQLFFELYPELRPERDRESLLHMTMLISVLRLDQLSLEVELSPRLILSISKFLGESQLLGDRVQAAHRLGQLLDLLLASEKGGERRRLGSYYTPPEVARALVERSWELVRGRIAPASSVPPTEPLLTICDPACGGGAFLVEAVRQVYLHRVQAGDPPQLAWARAAPCAYGIDISRLAIATTEAALALLAPRGESLHSPRLFVGDALLDTQPGASPAIEAQLADLPEIRLDARGRFAEVFCSRSGGFDWIVGNPPWVAFQGRATQPIAQELRAFYRARYAAFTGYPTTQGMFAERATELAPHGVISLLVPSSLSDLDGYAQARRVVTTSHRVAEPLLEFGQDAFAQVVQPCFGLIAEARAEPGEGSFEPFQLEERARLDSKAARIDPPSCLEALARLPTLPPQTFGELGFQSNSQAVANLFRRGPMAEAPFTVGLLEGRCVREFWQTEPKVYINPDPEALRACKVRLREAIVYQRVSFVVRQTASFTIAARHQGQYFRNSLIAGYASDELDPDLLVGLLNSALYRCLHLSRQRDARQATFPQVKVAHLRRLPAPPSNSEARARVRAVSAEATRKGGLTARERAQLDEAVFALFGLSASQGNEVSAYLEARDPKAISAKNEG